MRLVDLHRPLLAGWSTVPAQTLSALAQALLAAPETMLSPMIDP